MGELCFVTGNANKLREAKDLLDRPIVNCDIDLVEVQGSYEQIITHKLTAAVKHVKGPVFVEDTSLEFSAYGKELPGPYIKWFLKNLGPEGLVKMLDGFDDKGAAAVTTIGYCKGPNEEVHVFTGRTEGVIVCPRGSANFGWDPIFLPKESSRTYAEMTPEEKHRVSHRGKAFRAFKEFLK